MTINNIAYVNETVFENGRLLFAVVLKSRAMSDSKFYEVNTVEELPKTVQEFVNTRSYEMIEDSERFNFTRYQYK